MPYTKPPKILLFLFISFLLIFISFNAFAQRPQYKITAHLDTSTHNLIGHIDITYTNLSDQNLDKLGIHLWPNAYKDKYTALVKQKLHQGDLKLYRAKPSELGGLSGLKFSSTEQAVNLETDPENIDIARISLSRPLLPGSTIHLSSPFSLQIPHSFSRIGRTGHAYQLTQWYPHIAVFDEEGWHTMPYLDQGEYFNDFADYEVAITVPTGFMIAATGTLLGTKENGNSMTHSYRAENVIDFAWFASPTFRHESKKILIGDKEVELNLFVENVLNEDWANAMQYAERALQFYSDWLGPYPYDQMTVVHTPYSKAGYMEYPMVAQISYTGEEQLLDRVIAHEIGHTWLYGILASNERKEPWIDEGLNSFLENEYMHTYYDHPKENFFPKIIHSKHSMTDYDAYQHILRAAGDLEPPVANFDRQQSGQYIFSAYFLPLQGLQLMKEQVGHAKMKTMFRSLFNEHKFTHVSGEDVRLTFENTCQCNLSWFFDSWLHHAHEVDYRIISFDQANHKLTIENKSSVSLPLLISEYSGGEVRTKQWVEGFGGTKIISLNSGTDEVRLYDSLMAVNKKWMGNIRPANIFPSFSLFPKIGNYQGQSLAFTPVIGYNRADGGLPGIAITTTLFPQPKFKLFAMPMYGIESREFRYHIEGRFITDIKSNAFDKLLLGAAASNFGYNLDTHYLFRDHYVRLSPFIGLRFQKASPYSHFTSWLKYRYVDITQHYGQGVNFDDYIYSEEKRSYGIHELSFRISSDTVLKPFTSVASVQAGQGFLRLQVHYNQHFRGKDKMRGVWIHGFAGWLPIFKNPKANVLFTFNGTSSNGFFSRDYMYDEWLLGRNMPDGNLSRQVFIKDAGLKTLSTIGISKNWMTGAGFSAALPLKVIHFYMDGALYNSNITENVEFSYSGGVAIVLMKDVFEIYIPFIESRDIRESLTYQIRDRWFERISFQANFKFANPLYLIDHFQYKY